MFQLYWFLFFFFFLLLICCLYCDTLILEASKTRHSSFFRKNFDEVIQKFKKSVQKKENCLRTFLSHEPTEKDCQSWSMKELDFPEVTTTQLLRVISLIGYPIVKLPQTVGNLKHLRYFELVYAKIKELPKEIGHLCNLQTLLLRCCNDLIGLPDSIGKLKLLRYLDLSYSGVIDLPDSVCILYNLQKLLLGNCKKNSLTCQKKLEA